MAALLAGQWLRRSRNSSVDALRHGSTGAIAMRNSSTNPIGIVILVNYIRTIPIELDEAAAIEGAGYIRYVFQMKDDGSFGTIEVDGRRIRPVTSMVFVHCSTPS